jgi:cytoskeletal protein CcmA (bactofilin family)
MATAKDLGGGDNTVIGPSILINGKLTGDDDLTVRGRVEGELTLTKTLIVETSGVVKANVNVRNAIVSGVVVGNITATESVELTREGRMVGDIHAPRVIIVDGASFRGRVDMGNAEGAPRAEGRPQARPLVRPTTVRPVTTAPSRPAIPARTETRPAAAQAKPASAQGKPPAPPPPPKLEQKAGAGGASSAPAPAAVAAAGKKKLVIRKKGH